MPENESGGKVALFAASGKIDIYRSVYMVADQAWQNISYSLIIIYFTG